MVGVAPIDFKSASSSFNYGWYFHCNSSKFYSGPPHNYKGKKTNIKKPNNEITLILNLTQKTLKFITDKEYIENDCYSELPIDKPFSPVVFLNNKNDSVQITEC